MNAANRLYVHIPFCRAKCRYCDFFSVAIRAEPVRRYIRCLCSELLRAARPDAFETIYIGGGTPTALGPRTLMHLLDSLQSIVDLPSAAEFTVEANPGTLVLEKLRSLRRAGVNRLSVGVQSFDSRVLRLLGRIHSPQEARQAVQLARRAGFTNVSIDLIYGVPGQSLEDWRGDVEAAIALDVQHLSAYALTYEEGTPLHADLVQGRIDPAPQELECEMALWTLDRLRRDGFVHYEISNYARPGFECRHNLAYWANEPHLGIGAGAVSYLSGVRKKNVAQVQRYIECIERSADPAEFCERLDPEARARETAALALRTRRGLQRAAFRQQTGFDLDSLFGTSLVHFIRHGILTDDGERVALTDRGILFADEVAAAIV